MPEISTIRVPADFEREFPGASRSASEVAVNLARAQMALITEIERPAREAHGLSASAFQALAILDSAGEPLPGHVIAERLLVSSASMTSLVNTLERRGLVEQHPPPHRPAQGPDSPHRRRAADSRSAAARPPRGHRPGDQHPGRGRARAPAHLADHDPGPGEPDSEPATAVRESPAEAPPGQCRPGLRDDALPLAIGICTRMSGRKPRRAPP